MKIFSILLITVLLGAALVFHSAALAQGRGTGAENNSPPEQNKEQWEKFRRIMNEATLVSRPGENKLVVTITSENQQLAEIIKQAYSGEVSPSVHMPEVKVDRQDLANGVSLVFTSEDQQSLFGSWKQGAMLAHEILKTNLMGPGRGQPWMMRGKNRGSGMGWGNRRHEQRGRHFPNPGCGEQPMGGPRQGEGPAGPTCPESGPGQYR
ncbi:MAG: hypothetical protein OEZ59_02930 [Deltaproteobacteria bacterium]|nr:hypothetical protein [Deltaproteobacteria bacterium]